MKSNRQKIGQFIRPVSTSNKVLSLSRVRGVSITKQLIKTKANMKDVDISDYKVIQPKQFVFVPITSRNGEKLSIALNTEDQEFLVSKINVVFEVIDPSVLLPEFLLLWFKRAEFDRYSRFHSWGSAREMFGWEDMSEVEISIPDLQTQKEIVEIFENLSKNQKSYESSLSDLQLICDSYIENLKNQVTPVKLGEYIEKISTTNSNNELNSVVGISERKEFRKPGGKVNKDNLSNHLVVNKDEFAFIPRMNPFKPLAIALSFVNYPVLVSPSYVAFRVTDPKKLLPEFLFLFLKRKEFDRYAAYNAWSSTRDTFNWEDMCEVSIVVPDLEIQKAIVAVHQVLELRKRLNQDLLDLMVPISPVLLKGVEDEMARERK